MWAAVAGSWGEYADYVDERGADVTESMLARSLPQPGERVLELACGPGGVGRTGTAGGPVALRFAGTCGGGSSFQRRPGVRRQFEKKPGGDLRGRRRRMGRLIVCLPG
jgi:hypothetical protein